MADGRGRAVAASRELEEIVNLVAPFITLDNVSVRLGHATLFDGVCWQMLDDEHWAVVGPNGAGKSTLMRALSGSLPVAAGRIIYHFGKAEGSEWAQGQIAYVGFESQRQVLGEEAFYQERWNIGMNEDAPTVSDFLSEASIGRVNPFHVVDVTSDPEFSKRRGWVIEALELAHLQNRTLVQLSNGERRKVTIARALLADPRLIILDNPFAGLDEQFRDKLAENLDNLMQSKRRVIIVGTNRDEMPRRITHVLSIRDHRVVAQGPRQAVTLDLPPVTQGVRRLAALHVKASNGDSEPEQVTGQALVQMEKVTVSYNGNPVLKHVDWTVRENEQWALLGPNGAGKTTLLSLILADNPQGYANEITLFERRRGSGESIWEIKRHIGWVAPELQLYYPRNATCRDVVCSGWFDSVGLYRDCSPEERGIALAWLERFGLSERAGTSFEQVSEGEQRLVLFARALVKQPRLLVLDEPCAGLDAANRDRVLQAVDWVGRHAEAARGTAPSMIYVTHRADELPQTITHVLRLEAGRVVEKGRLGPRRTREGN